MQAEMGDSVLLGHSGPIDSVECIGESTVVTCSSRDKTVRLWDVRGSTKRAVRCFAGVEGGANHATGAGEAVLVACSSGELLSLDTRVTGEVVTRASKATLWRQQISDEVLNQSAVCAQEGVAVVCDDNGVLHRVVCSTGAVAFDQKHTSLCTSVALRSSCREAVSVGTDCVLKQWNIASNPPKLLKSHAVVPEPSSSSGLQLCNPPHLLSVACDPRRGALAAAACGDGRVLLWDCAKHKFIRSLSGGHSYSVSHVSWPTDELLMSAGNDGFACVWSVDPRKPKNSPKVPVRKLALEGKPNWAASSSAALYFAIGDRVVVLHNWT